MTYLHIRFIGYGLQEVHDRIVWCLLRHLSIRVHAVLTHFIHRAIDASQQISKRRHYVYASILLRRLDFESTSNAGLPASFGLLISAPMGTIC